MDTNNDLFYVVYDIESKRVINITMNCTEEQLRKAIPETQDFITTTQIPDYDVWYQYLTVQEGGLIVEDKVLTPQQEQEIINVKSTQEINVLKFKLKETDYYTLKYMEGNLSEEAFKEKSAYRQSLRDKIKELESKIVYPTV